MDEAAATSGVVTVRASVATDRLTLSVRGNGATPVDLDFLRSQLIHAYTGQLHAELQTATEDGAQQISFELDRPRREPSTQ